MERLVVRMDTPKKSYDEIGLRFKYRHHSTSKSEHRNWKGLSDHLKSKRIFTLNLYSKIWNSKWQSLRFRSMVAFSEMQIECIARVIRRRKCQRGNNLDHGFAHDEGQRLAFKARWLVACWDNAHHTTPSAFTRVPVVICSGRNTDGPNGYRRMHQIWWPWSGLFPYHAFAARLWLPIPHNKQYIQPTWKRKSPKPILSTPTKILRLGLMAAFWTNFRKLTCFQYQETLQSWAYWHLHNIVNIVGSSPFWAEAWLGFIGCKMAWKSCVSKIQDSALTQWATAHFSWGWGLSRDCLPHGLNNVMYFSRMHVIFSIAQNNKFQFHQRRIH